MNKIKVIIYKIKKISLMNMKTFKNKNYLFIKTKKK